MSNQLKKITNRAKQIRKGKPGMKWHSAIKQAGVDYRAGRLGSVKGKNRQTGSSNKKSDKKRTARPPGARIPAGGKKVTYYERRKNRSDVPGSLTGSMSGLKDQIKQKLANACLRYELANTIKATKAAQADKVKYRKLLRAFQ